MAEPNFGPIGDEPVDDLPRTFRREKEARQREAQERASRERAPSPSLSPNPDTYSDPVPGAQPAIADIPMPAVVRRFDVPFLHLVTFFLKSVIAAIPAMILLGVILWFGGHILQAFFPDLVKMKILLSFPGQ